MSLSASLTHFTLKTYQRTHRDTWGQALSLRVHRALSWLKRAEQERERNDTDAEFVFLWVAFNAAYTSQHSQDIRQKESEAREQFLQRIVGYDEKKSLYGIIWQQYAGVIRSLMDNPYVYQPFWDCANGESKQGWEESFAAAKKRSHQALAEQDVECSLSIVLSRLYTLRNQIIHGGATWNSSLNRQQLKDATALLGSIVPVVIDLMMQNGQGHWGEAVYFIER